MSTNFAIKFAELTRPTYTHFDGGDREVGQLMSTAALQNYFNGQSVGLNSMSGDKIDGVTNRHVSFKERQFYEQNGF